jgi:hypothetical protein
MQARLPQDHDILCLLSQRAKKLFVTIFYEDLNEQKDVLINSSSITQSLQLYTDNSLIKYDALFYFSRIFNNIKTLEFSSEVDTEG